MVVKHTDQALENWLETNIRILKKAKPNDEFEKGYIQALEETQAQLHAFWGSSLAPKD